jgi:hypothetical protein
VEDTPQYGGQNDNQPGRSARVVGDGDYNHVDGYENGVAGGSRSLDGFDRVRTSAEKFGDQDGLDEALVRMKRKAYIRDAFVTGIFVLAW